MLLIVIILVAVLGSIAKRTRKRSHADASIRSRLEPLKKRGQAVGFHEGLDRQSVKHAVARKVHGHARYLSAAAIDAADAS